MIKTSSARQLLSAATHYYDDPTNDLAATARRAATGGFNAGGKWMQSVLMVIRQRAVTEHSVPFTKLGVGKYSVALVAALMTAFLASRLGVWVAGISSLMTFYAVEAQWVFLFPLAIDGRACSWKQNRRLVRQAGGTLKVMATVIPIAATMLGNGFRGQGFVRSWAIGCLAVLLWYERIRTQVENTRLIVKWSFGERDSLQVRHERWPELGLTKPLRLLYISDLHLKGPKSSHIATEIIATARQSAPDYILLGGDMVDHAGGLSVLTETVRALREIAPVFAIAGNHDQFAGIDRVRAAAETGGAQWIEGQTLRLSRSDATEVILHGNYIAPANSSAIQILCAHDPALFPQAAERNYTVVLAGHLHGGQIVFAEHSGHLFPGAWFYRWNGLKFTRGTTTMLVSRGVTDTLPIRWNCPREVLLCELG